MRIDADCKGGPIPPKRRTQRVREKYEALAQPIILRILGECRICGHTSICRAVGKASSPRHHRGVDCGGRCGHHSIRPFVRRYYAWPQRPGLDRIRARVRHGPGSRVPRLSLYRKEQRDLFEWFCFVDCIDKFTDLVGLNWGAETFLEWHNSRGA